MLKQIKIVVGKAKNKDGKEFTTYKAVQKDGKFINCSFLRDVMNKPEETCFIEVDTKNINIDKNREWPKLWVAKVERLIDIETRRELSEEDLPF